MAVPGVVGGPLDAAGGLDVRSAPPAARAIRPRPPAAVVVPALAVGVLAVVPVAYLAVRAAELPPGAAARLVLDPAVLALLLRTCGLAAAVSAASVAIGVPVAWLTSRTDLPGRRIWVVLTCLPLAIPSYVGGFAWVSIFGPRGVLQGWLEPLGVHRLPSLYGFWGAWSLLTLLSYPYVVLTARAALLRLDPSLEEASQALGRNRRQTFARVVLPQLRPAVLAGGLLVALYAVHDFGAVSLLQFDSFTRVLFLRYRGSIDRSGVAALALVLVALAVVLVAAESRARGRLGSYAATGRRCGPGRPIPLGRWRTPALVGCGLLVALALVVPVGTVAGWFVQGLRAGEPLRLTAGAAGGSIRASGMGALAAVLAAAPVAALAARFPGPLARRLEQASFVGFALPGLVVALALVFMGVRLVPGLYQTSAMLTAAYVILFLPQAVGAIRGSLLQISPALEDASRSLGRTPLATLRYLVLPLVRPGVFAGFGLVFLTAMKELPATLLLAPTGFDTLAMQVWSASSEALYGRAAASALVLVALSALPLILFSLREREGTSGALH